MFMVLMIFFSACKKENNTTAGCWLDVLDTRIIVNSPATIKSTGAGFYIVEQGYIDLIFNPCNLNPAFQIDNLQVIISGNVKPTIQNGAGPCCTENFVITKIEK